MKTYEDGLREAADLAASFAKVARASWERHGLSVNALDSRGDRALAELTMAEEIEKTIRRRIPGGA